MRHFICSMFIVLTFAATTSLADTQWPQSFDLTGTSSAIYKFPVEQPGVVVISVQWQGDPVTVKLIKPKNYAMIFADTRKSPQQLQATATPDDVRTGALWTVEIYPALDKKNPNANHHAKGNVSVQVPARALAVSNMAGQVALAPAPGRNVAPTPGKPAPLPPPPPPPSRDEQTCFAYSYADGSLNVRCESSRNSCEQDVRTKTINGNPLNITVALGCSRAPLYCFAYNGGKSSVCYADGNECVSNRNSLSSQPGSGQISACRAYTIGTVQP